MPTFYQRRNTGEDQFVAATDYAFFCDPLGFNLAELPGGAEQQVTPSTHAAAILLAIDAAKRPPPAVASRSVRLRLAPGNGDERARADRIRRMRNKSGPVIYASVRPLHALVITGNRMKRKRDCQYLVVAYFVFLPFNRAPLSEQLRLFRTFDHEGDLETVQEALEVGPHNEIRILQLVMGNHGRRILALPEAIELDDKAGAGSHPRIWLDEGSHEPYPFRGQHGVLNSKPGVFYTPEREDFGGVRDAFLNHDAEPTEQNAIRATDLRVLPSERRHSVFCLSSYLAHDYRIQDAEFLMRFYGLYGKDDSPAGPPWNMWDLFLPSDLSYAPAPSGL